MTEIFTPDDCRQGVKMLMIETLGIKWARANIPPGYGLHAVADARPPILAVPDADLPGLYAKAQADALAALDAQGDDPAWWPRTASLGDPTACVVIPFPTRR